MPDKGESPMKPLLTLAAVLLVVASLSHSASGKERRRKPASPAPTMADVAYGKHERNKLDFWQARSRTKTPLLIFFHGGGFKKGDKNQIHHAVPVRDLMSRGISCVSVNYPFLQHTGNDYVAILRVCEKALSFIVGKSREWNLDSKRIVCSGPSAGALITEWLGCRTSKLSGLFVLLQPVGTSLLVLPQLKKGVPPIFIYHSSPLTDKVHHPRFAKMLKKACDEKGIVCTLYGTGKNGIPAPPKNLFRNRSETKAGVHKALLMKFLCDNWKLKISGK
jgi:predicted esterase